MKTRLINDWLRRASAAQFSFYAIAAAFSTYFCMYAFRKPFGAGSFEGEVSILGLPPISYKILFIIAQVVGYCISKFAGIKVISEMTPARRSVSIIAFIGVAWLALLMFAIVPAPYNAICMFINGIPLGMIWGLVFGFLEGRRVSEVLGAGLSASYILASGVVKGLGLWLIGMGVSEYWMPFTTGALFVIPMIVAVWMLSQMPPPDADDIASRTKREPMDSEARKAFFRSYAPGLIPLTALYILLTAFRDFRDNFAVEIWAAVGYEDAPAILALPEMLVTVVVLVTLAGIMVIKDNRRALLIVHCLMMGGTALIGIAFLCFQMEIIGPITWMILIGAGLYIAYVPYGCVLFDRLIAAVGAVGTAGFLIYVTDSFGYLGSVLLMLYRDFGQPDLSWLEFFTAFGYITAITCTVLFAVSLGWFAKRTRAME